MIETKIEKLHKKIENVEMELGSRHQIDQENLTVILVRTTEMIEKKIERLRKKTVNAEMELGSKPQIDLESFTVISVTGIVKKNRDSDIPILLCIFSTERTLRIQQQIIQSKSN